MTGYAAALSAEVLKARRSMVPWLALAGLTLLPLVGGLFMYILKDPARAQEMGLIGQKAQLQAGVADWPTLLGMIAQGIAIGGSIVFALFTSWLFGREFADRTVRTLLALPTPRWAVVAAKGTVAAGWCAVLSLWVLGLALGVGTLSDIPGGTAETIGAGAVTIGLVAALTIALQAVTALVASMGRGYLAPVGWTFMALAFANILAVMGWGAWFPWSVPALASGMAGPDMTVGVASYAVVVLTAIAASAGTVTWWNRADQTG